jgi:hypothetical protein
VEVIATSSFQMISGATNITMDAHAARSADGYTNATLEIRR